MKRWVYYGVVFLLGGLSAYFTNPSLFSRNTSQRLSKHPVISEGAASVSVTPFGETETVQVVHVIDGDTVELGDRRRVRYIGIDAPELGDGRTAVACFAKEAMEENRRLVEGKTVRLQKDVSEKDRYGRHLRYVYSGDVFVNDRLVRQGYASVVTFPPDVRFQEQFLDAQRGARREGRGLWKQCY